MLVLSRKVGERIVVGDKVIITVVRMGQGSVRIGVDAPGDMTIVREELLRTGAKGGASRVAEQATNSLDHTVELCDAAAVR
jgi:carbon storage regulator